MKRVGEMEVWLLTKLPVQLTTNGTDFTRQRSKEDQTPPGAPEEKGRSMLKRQGPRMCGFANGA